MITYYGFNWRKGRNLWRVERDYTTIHWLDNDPFVYDQHLQFLRTEALLQLSEDIGPGTFAVTTTISLVDPVNGLREILPITSSVVTTDTLARAEQAYMLALEALGKNWWEADASWYNGSRLAQWTVETPNGLIYYRVGFSVLGLDSSS